VREAGLHLAGQEGERGGDEARLHDAAELALLRLLVVANNEQN
jgi:hypothetical protein